MKTKTKNSKRRSARKRVSPPQHNSISVGLCNTKDDQPTDFELLKKEALVIDDLIETSDKPIPEMCFRVRLNTKFVDYKLSYTDYMVSLSIREWKDPEYSHLMMYFSMHHAIREAEVIYDNYRLSWVAEYRNLMIQDNFKSELSNEQLFQILKKEREKRELEVSYAGIIHREVSLNTKKVIYTGNKSVTYE